MDSRRGIWRVVLTILLSVITTIWGCKNPDIEVEFRQGDKYTENLKFDVIEDTLWLELGCYGLFGAGYDEYSMMCDLDIRSPLAKANIKVFPDSVNIWFGKTELDFRRWNIWDNGSGTDNFSYSYSFVALCNPKQDLIDMCLDNNFETDFLTFYLGNLIQLNDCKIVIDTIYARDTKAKWLKERLMQNLTGGPDRKQENK